MITHHSPEPAPSGRRRDGVLPVSWRNEKQRYVLHVCKPPFSPGVLRHVSPHRSCLEHGSKYQSGEEKGQSEEGHRVTCQIGFSEVRTHTMRIIARSSSYAATVSRPGSSTSCHISHLPTLPAVSTWSATSESVAASPSRAHDCSGARRRECDGTFCVSCTPLSARP